ncbi:hypothetical protein FBALC1_03997 [Flavobacteriales bacterium ALC-1]|nr:hypothetical protein FBALC1_03997 [Flavobacteriales bacterium ALC-1]
MNFWETIFLFFAFLSFMLFVLFFFKKKGDKVANKILGIYLLLFTLNLVYNVLHWSKLLLDIKYIHIIGSLTIIWASYPPLMYLYTKRVITQKKFKKIDLLHTIPTFMNVFFYSPFLMLNTKSKIDVLNNGLLSDYIYLNNYTYLVTSTIMVFYVILIYLNFKNNKSLESNKRRWLKWIIGAFYCYVLAMLSYFVLSYFKLISTEHDYFIMYTIIFFIGLVTYFGFMQPEVFNGLSMDKILPFKKYQKTGLSESLSLELKGQLIDLMKNKKPYLNPDLRLSDLAENLNISKHHASQIINEHFNSSFFFFINTYRIKEAKILLENDCNLNISDVIYSSGFNNRVSFYKAFKKHMGVTPTQYKLQNV